MSRPENNTLWPVPVAPNLGYDIKFPHQFTYDIDCFIVTAAIDHKNDNHDHPSVITRAQVKAVCEELTRTSSRGLIPTQVWQCIDTERATSDDNPKYPLHVFHVQFLSGLDSYKHLPCMVRFNISDIHCPILAPLADETLRLSFYPLVEGAEVKLVKGNMLETKENERLVLYCFSSFRMPNTQWPYEDVRQRRGKFMLYPGRTPTIGHAIAYLGGEDHLGEQRTKRGLWSEGKTEKYDF